MSTIPASGFGVPLSGRLTPTGQLAQTSIVMIATDTGFLWRASLAGTPPVWGFTAVPDCADIEADFATVAALEGTVGSCAQLQTWGFN